MDDERGRPGANRPNRAFEPGASHTRAAEHVGKQEVELYIRTYNTLLRSSSAIKLDSLINAHRGIASALHPDADRPTPDTSALIYSILRLPECIIHTDNVLLGQSYEIFHRAGYPQVEDWQIVRAPARRRRWAYDGNATVAVTIGSASDVDDMVPTLVAYQIEWNKLHALLNADPSTMEIVRSGIGRDSPLYLEVARVVRERLFLDPDDWERLETIWDGHFWHNLMLIGTHKKDLSIRMLGGTHIGYARATYRWWRPIEMKLRELGRENNPVYLVSSNPHSMVNLLSGFASRRKDELERLVRTLRDPELWPEYEKMRRGHVRGNWENFYYYSARKLLFEPRRGNAMADRTREEEERGIFSVGGGDGIKVDAQIIQLNRLRPGDFDPRVALPGTELLAESDAIVLNIDYPLGLMAYHILVQLAESLVNIRGLYVLGKAATLNGAIGDAMIPDVVFDEHSGCTYWLDNCFAAGDLSPYLMFGSVLDGQKAVTVKGTFLQNRAYLDFYYRENFTIVEMEAGPYLNALYEMVYPSRHPANEHVSLAKLPIDLGVIHYASDTPYTRGKNLGARKASYYGMDSAYASSVAILRRIIGREIAANQAVPRAEPVGRTA